MKRLCIGLVLATAALLLIPFTASAATYETYVACDYEEESLTPSHVCHSDEAPAAFFGSDADTEVEFCFEVPSGGGIECAEPFPAEAGVLYYYKIPDPIEGDYFFQWFVEGLEVGSWDLRVDPPAPPPVPPTPAPTTPPAVVAPPPLTVAPVPSAACTKAKKRVRTLRSRLQKASDPKVKAGLRVKLKRARAAARRLC